MVDLEKSYLVHPWTDNQDTWSSWKQDFTTWTSNWAWCMTWPAQRDLPSWPLDNAWKMVS